MRYIKTDTVLDRILANTAQQLDAVRADLPRVRAEAEAAPAPRDAVSALHRPGEVALIAECKKASPSAGVLLEPFDVLNLAKDYTKNGAAAISVLTDERFFQGHIDYLREVSAAVDVPVLRKDFIIDQYQIYEARAAGADMVLLIVAALADDQLAELHALTDELGMTALVEVHNERELERAMTIEPRLLGVNNRDLCTFVVDLETTARLIEAVPGDVTFVAESGIKTAADVRRMGALGAHAVLVGEALVTAGDQRSALVRAFSSQPRGRT